MGAEVQLKDGEIGDLEVADHGEILLLGAGQRRRRRDPEGIPFRRDPGRGRTRLADLTQEGSRDLAPSAGP